MRCRREQPFWSDTTRRGRELICACRRHAPTVGAGGAERQDASLTMSAMLERGGATLSAEGAVPDISIVLVTFPDAQILDVTGPLEVFSSASSFLPDVSYRTQLVSAKGGMVRASCGMHFATSSIYDVSAPIDTLMIAGGRDMDNVDAHDPLLDEIRRLAGSARRVTSVCTGAFVLAAAGLLSGRRATTHWFACDLLDTSYPDLTVESDAIYVHDGKLWTSAGVTAGIDLSLALVAEDHGRQAAATVARRLVVYLRRSGGQAQFSALLAAQSVDSDPIRDLLSWLPDHLAQDLSVPEMAQRVHLSERQFSRVFRAEVGTSPADHVEAARLESACRLLETTHSTIDRVAKDSGFGTPETMNRVFRRRLNTTPGEHRRHFSSVE
jgi:transcriptional regulator GlxA family with amidase domain